MYTSQEYTWVREIGEREEDTRTSIHMFAFIFECSLMYRKYTYKQKTYIFWGCVLKLFKIDKVCDLRYLTIAFVLGQHCPIET